MNSIDRRLARLLAKMPKGEMAAREAAINRSRAAAASRPLTIELVEIYFFGCGDWIKIGRTTNSLKRFAILENSNPYPTQFLGSFMAPAERENELHEQFRALRHKGEWFRKSPELLALILELCWAEQNESGTETSNNSPDNSKFANEINGRVIW